MVWCVKQLFLLKDKHENLSESTNVILKKKVCTLFHQTTSKSTLFQWSLKSSVDGSRELLWLPDFLIVLIYPTYCPCVTDADTEGHISIKWPKRFISFVCVTRACGILVPRPGIEAEHPAVETWSLNHWIAREVPRSEV